MAFTLRQKAQFYNQLHISVKAGIPLELALSKEVLPENTGKSSPDLASAIQSGMELSQVLRKSRLISEWEMKLLWIGEQSGGMQSVLQNLAEYFNRREAQYRDIKSKLLYPFILILAVTIIPPLPQLASGSMGIVAFVTRITAVIFMSWLAFELCVRTPFNKSSSGGFNPLILKSLKFVDTNHVFRQVYEVAYLDMLTLCFQCGLDVLQTLRLMQSSAVTRQLKRRHSHAITDVERQGVSLVQALYDNHILANRQIKGYMIASEQSGTLHSELRKFVISKKDEVDKDVSFLYKKISAVIYASVVIYVAFQFMGVKII